MPDVYLCMDGVPVWVELKIVKNGKVNPSKSQIAWHSSHSRCNGVSFFLAHDPATGGVYLFDGASAIDLLGSKMCDLRPAIRWSGDLRSAPTALRDLSKELWFGPA